MRNKHSVVSNGAVTEAEVENTPIREDTISAHLLNRWYACYMLYDYNRRHADNAIFNHGGQWADRAREIVRQEVRNGTYNAADLEKRLTEAYNLAISEDVEEFVKEHLQHGSASSRAELEVLIAGELGGFTPQKDK